MTNLSHEDTMIGVSPSTDENLIFADSERAFESDPNLIERCRALFRSFGERVTSFDLSRQIYG